MLRVSMRLFIACVFTVLFISIKPAPSPLAELPSTISAVPKAAPAHARDNLDTPPSTGHASRTTLPASESGISSLTTSVMSAAYAVELYPNERMRYIPDTGSPDEWLDIGGVSGTTYFAGDFVGRDYNRLYVLDLTLKELHTLATDDGTDTTIGACHPLSGQVWSGATGTADGILYASSTDGATSYLYKINTTTGAATVVGQITNAPAIIDIAINANGTMYGLDIGIDALVRINKSTGDGTVIGSIGFDANYPQGMDFEEESGVLYLAAYNDDSNQGELRIANTTTGNATLVGPFPEGAEIDALAFTPQPGQRLLNPGFENGWLHWTTQSDPILSSTSHNGSSSVMMTGEETWVWQNITIPADALEINLSYWITGISSDNDPDNDIVCGMIWDQTWQTEYANSCYGMFYFYSYPMTWKHRIYRLTASELANVAGKNVKVAFRLTQDWLSGYSKTSTAYIDDTTLTVTRPIYDYVNYLPMALR